MYFSFDLEIHHHNYGGEYSSTRYFPSLLGGWKWNLEMKENLEFVKRLGWGFSYIGGVEGEGAEGVAYEGAMYAIEITTGVAF